MKTRYAISTVLCGALAMGSSLYAKEFAYSGKGGEVDGSLKNYRVAYWTLKNTVWDLMHEPGGFVFDINGTPYTFGEGAATFTDADGDLLYPGASWGEGLTLDTPPIGPFVKTGPSVLTGTGDHTSDKSGNGFIYKAGTIESGPVPKVCCQPKGEAKIWGMLQHFNRDIHSMPPYPHGKVSTVKWNLTLKDPNAADPNAVVFSEDYAFELAFWETKNFGGEYPTDEGVAAKLCPRSYDGDMEVTFSRVLKNTEGSRYTDYATYVFEGDGYNDLNKSSDPEHGCDDAWVFAPVPGDFQTTFSYNGQDYEIALGKFGKYNQETGECKTNGDTFWSDEWDAPIACVEISLYSRHNEGCAPDYWAELDECEHDWPRDASGAYIYSPTDLFDDTFALPAGTNPGLTLWDAISAEGGDATAILHAQAVAALLDSVSGIDYPLDLDEIKEALATGNLTMLTDANEQCCPLDERPVIDPVVECTTLLKVKY